MEKNLQFPLLISSDYFKMLLFLQSVFGGIIFFISLTNIKDIIWISLLLVLIIIALLTLLFRNKFKLHWVIFEQDQIKIRGTHSFVKIDLIDIKSASIARSRDDEESILTKAYVLNLKTTQNPKLKDSLSVNGIENSDEKGNLIIRARISGINHEEDYIRSFLNSWIEHTI